MFNFDIPYLKNWDSLFKKKPTEKSDHKEFITKHRAHFPNKYFCFALCHREKRYEAHQAISLLDVIAFQLGEESFSVDTKEFSGLAFIPVLAVEDGVDVFFLDFT